MAADSAPNEAYGQPVLLSEGPFAGWMTWHGQDAYETHVGPFVYRLEPDGSVISAFMPEKQHLNGGGAIHGGALMSFADFALFAIAHNMMKGAVNAVTLTLNGEFVGAGELGAPVIARGEIIRETGGLVFERGILTQNDRPLLTFSGTLRKLKNRPPRD